jgi:hypothetical protein
MRSVIVLGFLLAACGGSSQRPAPLGVEGHLAEAQRHDGEAARFGPVEGLTAQWLRMAITSHQARAAALGYDPGYMAYDPSAVAGVEVEVIEDDDLVVVSRASDDATAVVVHGRAEELSGGRW